MSTKMWPEIYLLVILCLVQPSIRLTIKNTTLGILTPKQIFTPKQSTQISNISWSFHLINVFSLSLKDLRNKKSSICQKCK